MKIVVNSKCMIWKIFLVDYVKIEKYNILREIMQLLIFDVKFN